MEVFQSNWMTATVNQSDQRHKNVREERDQHRRTSRALGRHSRWENSGLQPNRKQIEAVVPKTEMPRRFRDVACIHSNSSSEGAA